MSQRTEETFRCPHDGRSIAKVIVVDGARCTWFPPAHNGHLASVREGLELEIERWGRSSHSDEMKAAMVARLRGAIDGMAAEPNKPTPAQIEPLPSDFDLGQVQLGFEPLPRWSNCPRCHALYQFRIVVSPEGRWTAVLA